MDRQRLELGRNAYDAFVTLPRWRRISRTDTCSPVVVLQAAAAAAAGRQLTSVPCASSIWPTSVFRSSAPTASRRWRRVMRWRRAGTASSWSCGRTRTRRPRDPFAYYGLPPLERLSIETRAGRPARPPRGGSDTWRSPLGRVAGRARPDVVLHARPRRRVARSCGFRVRCARRSCTSRTAMRRMSPRRCRS